MATLSNSQRLREARKKREEESKNSSSQSASRNYRNSEKLEMRKLERNIGLDTFESDLTSMGTTLQGIYSDWQSPETMTNTRASVESMMNRINDFQTYQSKYGSTDASNISEIASAYQSVLDDWDTLSNAYGYYQNADAFNSAKKKAQFDEQFSGLSYDDVQKKMKEYDEDSDEYKYLSEYTNYSDLRDFDMALTSAKTNLNVTRAAINPNAPKKDDKFDAIEKAMKNTPTVANGSAIAYNPNKQGSQGDYLKELETLRNQYALDHQFDLYKDYMNAEDFEEKSQYVPSKGKDDKWWQDTSDETYEYINNVDGARSRILGNHDKYQANAPIYTPSPYVERGLAMLTEEEIAVYNYLYSEDKKLADKFLEDMEVTLTKRASDKNTTMIEEAVDDSVLTSVGLSLASPILNIGGGIYSGIDTLSSNMKGEVANPYNPYHNLVNTSATIREEVGENIAEATEGWEVFGQNIPSFLYQTGMSVGDTLVGGKGLGSAYTVIMGLNSAQQTSKDLMEAGATEEQILRGSLLSGAAEMIFEKVSLDNWLKIKGADSLKKVIKETAKQMAIEGSEELLTEVANIMIDDFNRGSQSDAYKMYEEYLARGFSEEEAEKMTKQELAKQIGWAAVGGALSGMALGGTSSLTSHHDLSNTGKAIRSNDRVQEMMDMYDTMELQGLTQKESEALKLYAEYGQKGVNADTISNAQLGNLYQTSEREAIDTIKSKKSTDAQKTEAMKRLDSLDVIATSKPMDEIARKKRVESLNKGEVTEVTSTGNSTKIEGIRIEDGDTIVLTSEGEVKAEDMTFSYNDAEILSYAENMSEEKANLLLSQYDGKADADSYVKSFNLAYAYGETGFGAESVLKNKGVLSESQASEIYKNAVLNRANEQQKAIDEVNAKHGKTTVLKGKFNDSVIDYSGKSKDTNKVNWKKLTTRQKSAITFAKAFSKVTGVNINLVQSNVVDGKRVGKNGSYNPKTNTIDIDVYAGIIDAKSVEDSIIPTLSHEVTHWMKAKAPAMYSKMTEYISETLVADGKTTMDKLIDDEMNRMKEAHPEMNVTAEMAIEEIVARASEDMLSNSDTARKLLNRMSESEKQSFIKKVKETFKNLISWVNDLLGQYKSESEEAKVLRQYKERLKELSKMWDQALAEAIQTNQNMQKEGIENDIALLEKNGVLANENSATVYSVRYLLDEKTKDKVASDLVNVLGVSKEDAMEYLKAESSIASIVLNPKHQEFLDYEADENEVAIKKNSDYPQGTVDFSNICAKRRDFTSVMNRVMSKFKDHIFLSTDLAKIRTIMSDEKITIPCGICYVEDRRQLDSIVAEDFVKALELYRNGSKTRPDGKAFNTNQLKALKMVENDTYTPSIYELITLEGRNALKEKDSNMESAWVNYNNARGMQSVRLLTNEAEYRREILGYSKTEVKRKNDLGGLRIYSFSDAEIPHLIDLVQVITDSASKGLAIQGYTKVNWYANMVRDTGVKLNRSLIPAGDLGYHVENGKVVLDYDTVEGIDIHDKDFFDSTDYDNVGNIVIGINEVQIRAAMLDTFVDYIIPFHTGQSGEVLREKGIDKWQNYKNSQSERNISDGKKSATQINIYTDVIQKSEAEGNPIKNKVQFVEKFLAVCKENGLIPRFSEFLNTDENGDYIYTEGYHKFIIDFKTFHPITGEYLPQMPVKPNFDNEFITKTLKEFVKAEKVKQAELQPKMDKAIARIEEEVVGVRYSDRDSEGTQLTKEQTEFFKDSKVIDENGNLKVMYHGTERGGFTVFNRDFSDDGRSFFFTDSPMVAKGYSGTYDEIIPGKKLSVDEMTDIINDSYLWVEYDNGEYQIVRNKYGEFKVEYSNKDYDEFVEYLTEEYGSNESGGNYKVYLNIKNPLVVDAQGRNWDDLPITQTKNVSRYNYIYVTKGANGKYNVEWEDMMNKYGDAETAELTFAEIKSKFGEYVADEIKHGSASIENIIIDSRNKELIPRTTRQYSYYAEKHGYDGVIIEDVLDTAIYASGKEKYQTSTVAIAFNPNQIKSVANTNPTENNDMRYSDRDSEGNRLSTGQIEFFSNSKVRDKDGNLLKMYHGTFAEFTTFDIEKTSEDAYYGRGFYFTSDENDAKKTYAEASGVDTQLKVDEEASWLLDSWGYAFDDIPNEYNHKLYTIDKHGYWNPVSEDKAFDLYKKAVNQVTKEKYSNGRVIPVYLNVQNPYIVEEGNLDNPIKIEQEARRLGRDGIIDYSVAERFNLKKGTVHVVAFSPSQAKLTSNENPTDNSDMRYSDRESATDWLIGSIDDYLAELSIEDLVDEVSDDSNTNVETPKVERVKRRVDEVNKRLKEIGLSFNGTKSLAWTDERIDKYLSGGYYGSSNPNYAQAYITYMTPQQFLNLTVGSKLHTVDMIQNESEAYGEVDIEKLGNSSPIFLDIEEGRVWTKVTGHEGRHRMYLLGKAGFDKVPVLLFDYRTKYDKTAKDEMKLIAQRYNDTELVSKSRNVVINDVIPFSNANRDLIVERFGSGNENADIRYSDREGNTASFNGKAFWSGSVSLVDGVIEEVHTYAEAENAGFHHSLYFSPEQVDKMDGEENAFFWVDNGKVEIWRDDIPSNIIREIKKQITIFDDDVYADRTLTRAEANKLARQKVASYKEQMEKKAKIESITQKALVLNKWMLNNSKDEHIPEAMKPVVAHLLKAIDFSSKQYLGMRGGKHKGMPTRTDLSLAQALADVQKMMAKAEVDGDVLFELYGADLDEDMDALVKSVNLYMRTVGDNEFVLNQMTLDELHRFDKIVGAIKSSVSKMNRFHVANTTKTIAEITHQDINHFNSLGKAKLHKGKFASNVSQMLNWGNATPYYAFKRFGEGGMKVYEALQDGWDKFAFHIKKIIDYAEGTYSSEDVKKWSEEVHEFDVLMPATEEQLNDPKFKGNHKKIQMTTAQIMSLYCLQKREQAKKHLRGGGIRIANFTTKDGVVEQAEGVVLMDKEVDKIINVLTLDQIAVANRLQKFMNEDCVDWGNEISMKRFGYKAFGEENYFPIKSDDNVTGTGEVKEKEKSLYRLLNLSFTKSLVKEANNRIVVDSIFDVFAQHTSEMAKYNALALPVLDAVRWFNYKEKGKKVDTHFETRSLKAAMESAFGKDANNYVATFLQDINGADNVGRDRIAKGFMKNAKIASVGFNAKVVALQPTSYLRASAVIDNKYLVQALSKKPKMAMAEKWCGMAQWKALGFIDINVQRGVADLIKHEESAMDKMTELAMKGAEIADKVTLGYLWNACEAEIKDKNPGLTVGSEAFNKAVGKRLRDIIYATQVVDSTMTRSQMMRSTDGWDKVLTNFASEPTLSYNMLMDAYYDYKLTERQTGSRSKAFSKNGKKLARTMYAYTITSAITALLELGFEIFRDDEELSPEDMMKMYLENVYLNMSIVNKIPYAKEAISILQGFTSNRMDTQWMQYFSYAAKGWMKLLSGEGNAYKTLQNTIKGLSYGFGIPIHNLTRDINALMDKLGILTSDDLEDMFNDTIGEAFPSLKTNK